MFPEKNLPFIICVLLSKWIATPCMAFIIFIYKILLSLKSTQHINLYQNHFQVLHFDSTISVVNKINSYSLVFMIQSIVPVVIVNDTPC